MQKAKVKKTYAVMAAKELSIDWDGDNFLVIIGKHINGWYIAIPNWNICIEAGEPTDNFYNSEKLSKALNNVNMGSAIADAVAEYWRGEQNNED